MVKNGIVVIGAGITGMSIAIMLARQGLSVLVIDRDEREMFGRCEEYPALRAGAPHSRRPHQLMAGARDILRRSLPEVLREVYELGARDAVEYRGASRVAFVGLRRTLLERALLTCADELPSLSLRFGEKVVDLAAHCVRTSRATYPAGVVIDASGMHARLYSPSVSLRSWLYYTSQPFRLTGAGFEAAEGAIALWVAPPYKEVAHVRLFVHDPPFASVLVALRGDAQPPDRELVDGTYRSVLSSERLLPFVRGAEQLAPIQDWGFLRSRIRLAESSGGILQIGDAVAALNPLTSRGAALGLVQAELLAEAILRDPGDHEGQRAVLRRAYHEWVAPHWAMGVAQEFLRPGVALPPQVAGLIATARRRWRRILEIREAWHAPDGAGRAEEMRTALEVLALQTPPSVLDSLEGPKS